jgi:hypothetical protein
MVPRSLAVPLAALALAGCLSTQDEPFPLVGGDTVAAPPGDYACRSVDAHGAAKAERGRLIRLRRDRQTQYVFIAPDNSSAEPATLHRVADGVYLVAVAHAEGPGEDLYLAAAPAGGASFRLYVPAEAAVARAQTLARQRGVSLTHSPFSDDLSGATDAQRAVVLAFASDLSLWRQTAECQAVAPRPR